MTKPPTAEEMQKYLDPVVRISMAKAAIDDHLAEIQNLSLVRTHAARQLKLSHSVAEIADLLGVKTPAVYKLIGGARTIHRPNPVQMEDGTWEAHCPECGGQFATGPRLGTVEAAQELCSQHALIRNPLPINQGLDLMDKTSIGRFTRLDY